MVDQPTSQGGLSQAGFSIDDIMRQIPEAYKGVMASNKETGDFVKSQMGALGAMKGVDPEIALYSGLLKPTKSGSFGESLGNAGEGYYGALNQQKTFDLEKMNKLLSLQQAKQNLAGQQLEMSMKMLPLAQQQAGIEAVRSIYGNQAPPATAGAAGAAPAGAGAPAAPPVGVGGPPPTGTGSSVQPISGAGTTATAQPAPATTQAAGLPADYAQALADAKKNREIALRKAMITGDNAGVAKADEEINKLVLAHPELKGATAGAEAGAKLPSEMTLENLKNANQVALKTIEEQLKAGNTFVEFDDPHNGQHMKTTAEQAKAYLAGIQATVNNIPALGSRSEAENKQTETRQKLYEDTLNQSRNSKNLVNQIDGLYSTVFDDKGNSRVNTGSIGNVIQSAASTAKQLGVDDKTIGNLLTTDPNAGDVLKKNSITLATSMLKQMMPANSPIRVSEFQAALESLPSENVLPAAIAEIRRIVKLEAEHQTGVANHIVDMNPLKDNISGEIHKFEDKNPRKTYKYVKEGTMASNGEQQLIYKAGQWRDAKTLQPYGD